MHIRFRTVPDVHPAASSPEHKAHFIDADGKLGTLNMRAKTMALAAAVALPTLLLGTACSSDGGADGAAGKGPDRVKLDQAALVTGDVPDYEIMQNTQTATDSSAKSDDAKCQPIINAIGDRVNRKAQASVLRSMSNKLSPSDIYALGLTSYTKPDAEEAMRDLRSAVKHCGSGFVGTSLGKPLKYTSVKPTKATGGDEAVGFELVGEGLGKRATVNYVIMRQDSTLAMFLAADANMKRTVAVPKEVVAAQAAKIAKVLR